MEGHVMDQATPRPQTCGAVVSLVIGHAPGVLRRLHLRTQQGMIAVFDPEDIVQIIGVQGRDVGSMGTQAVFSDEALEVRVLLAQLRHQALGGMPFAIIVVGSIVFDDRCRPQRHHGPHVWMDERCTQHLLSRGDTPVAVHLVQTRRTVNRRGGNIPRAIKRHSRGAIPKRHRFQRLAALALPKDACEQRAAPLGCDRLQYLAPVRVTRDMLNPIDCFQIARCPFLGKGESRGRLAGKQGEGRHQPIGSRDLRIAKAIIWDGGKAASNQAKERIRGKMLAPFGGNNRHGNPRPGDRKLFL